MVFILGMCVVLVRRDNVSEGLRWGSFKCVHRFIQGPPLVSLPPFKIPLIRSIIYILLVLLPLFCDTCTHLLQSHQPLGPKRGEYQVYT